MCGSRGKTLEDVRLPWPPPRSSTPPANVASSYASSRLVVRSRERYDPGGVVFLLEDGFWPLGLLVLFCHASWCRCQAPGPWPAVWDERRAVRRIHLLARSPPCYRVVDVVPFLGTGWSMLDIFAVNVLWRCVGGWQGAWGLGFLPGPGGVWTFPATVGGRADGLGSRRTDSTRSV